MQSQRTLSARRQPSLNGCHMITYCVAFLPQAARLRNTLLINARERQTGPCMILAKSNLRLEHA